MQKLIGISNVKKQYSKSKIALDGIDLEIPVGKIIGLLGPNGSGKTTFMKMLAGIARPTEGKIYIDGQEPGVYTKSIVSYLPDQNQLFKWMKVQDAVAFYTDFFQDFEMEKAKELLTRFEIGNKERVTSLSKGTVEKLNLILCLSRKAKLYVLDEPLGGVDPVARDQIIDMILDHFHEDCTMIISTHIVSEMERLFDEVLFLQRGKIVLGGNAEELRLQRAKSIDAVYREVFAQC